MCSQCCGGERSRERWQRWDREQSLSVKDHDSPEGQQQQQVSNSHLHLQLKATKKKRERERKTPRRKHAMWQIFARPCFTCAFANTFREFTCSCASTRRRCLGADDRHSPAEFGRVFPSLSDERGHVCVPGDPATRSTVNVVLTGERDRETLNQPVCLLVVTHLLPRLSQWLSVLRLFFFHSNRAGQVRGTMQMKKHRDSDRSGGDMLEADGLRKKSSCFSNIKIFLISECALMLAQGTVGAYLVSATHTHTHAGTLTTHCLHRETLLL